VYCVCAIVVLSIFLKNLYALFHFKGLKLAIVDGLN
jgi:predicted nucleic acid-binding Zn finger protein